MLFIQIGQIMSRCDDMEKGEERYFIIFFILASICLSISFIYLGGNYEKFF